MTAAELTCEILDRRNISVKDKEYWNCWEVIDKEETGETDMTAIQCFGLFVSLCGGCLVDHHSLLVDFAVTHK